MHGACVVGDEQIETLKNRGECHEIDVVDKVDHRCTRIEGGAKFVDHGSIRSRAGEHDGGVVAPDESRGDVRKATRIPLFHESAAARVHADEASGFAKQLRGPLTRRPGDRESRTLWRTLGRGGEIVTIEGSFHEP